MKNINIERNVTINAKNRTIEITKQFQKAASRFGSEEYKALRDAQNENPSYKVVIKKSCKKSTDSNKGLTYSYMEKYIENHDDEKKSIMEEYKMMRGTSVEALELEAESCSYQDIKEWFFGKYPAIEAFYKKREALMEKITA